MTNTAIHSILFSPLIGNDIGDTGVTSLSEALRSNTTLTELDLDGEDDRKKTRNRHPLTIHSFFLLIQTGNYIEDTGATSLSDALKSNTTLTKVNLKCEYKRRHKRHSSTIHSFHFYSLQQTTTLEKQVQHH
jgi:hypothetical protein